MTVPTLETERLRLRAWRPADREPFAAINADPEAMRWIGDGAPLPRADSDRLADLIEGQWRSHGFGLWAVDDADGFVGFAGLTVPWFLPAILPAVEVGWRLGRAAWGRGYATEAAAAALAHGFGTLGLEEVVATILPGNDRSIRVAEKLGLRFTGERAHPSGRAVAIYRIRR